MLYAALSILLIGQTPTGPQVVQRCLAAYDRVKTLEVDVNAALGTNKGTAHVSFQRPGKLRVS